MDWRQADNNPVTRQAGWTEAGLLPWQRQLQVNMLATVSQKGKWETVRVVQRKEIVKANTTVNFPVFSLPSCRGRNILQVTLSDLALCFSFLFLLLVFLLHWHLAAFSISCPPPCLITKVSNFLRLSQFCRRRCVLSKKKKVRIVEGAQKRCFSLEWCCRCHHVKGKKTSLETRMFIFYFFIFRTDSKIVCEAESEFVALVPLHQSECLCLKIRCSKTEDTKNRISSKMTHF